MTLEQDARHAARAVDSLFEAFPDLVSTFADATASLEAYKHHLVGYVWKSAALWLAVDHFVRRNQFPSIAEVLEHAEALIPLVQPEAKA